MLERLREDFVFFLAGFGAEYSLQPVARYLESSGCSVVVADMQVGPLPPLPAKPAVFISSQHPSCSSFAFRRTWGNEPPYSNYIGPLEIIRHLQPRCSVFVPHDLETPIRPDELPYMAEFDIYCAPSGDVNPTLRHACTVVPTGWVKHNHFDDLSPELNALVASHGMFFLNQIVSLMPAGGAAFVHDNYPAIFSTPLPVKLPSWPGCDRLGNELRQLGATMIAAEAPSAKLIAASPRIYVNAPGSVIAEARLLGTPVILAGQAGHPDLNLNLARPASVVSPFDFNGLMAAIAAHIGTNP